MTLRDFIFLLGAQRTSSSEETAGNKLLYRNVAELLQKMSTNTQLTF